MATIRVTKEFHFEMAHALHNYDGLCKNIHGHSYKLLVTLRGTPIPGDENTKYGMVMDFGDLKKIVNKAIIDKYDHSLVLNQKTRHTKLNDLDNLFGKVYFLSYQPTCENLLQDFAKTLKELLPQNVELFCLKLFETATSYAEWYAEDNQ